MITLIFCGDLRYCPYLKRYTERLEKLKADYEVLFWNRAGFSLDLPENYYFFNSPSAEKQGKLKKAFDFYRFWNWMNKHLSVHKTDGLILLSTLTGFLLYLKLKKYPYIFDIRDYSYDNISLFRKLEEKIINRSYFTCISSKGFKAFLPDHPYVIAHNFNRNEIPAERQLKKTAGPINIVWNGTVRFFDYQRKYLDLFKNDSRFQMIYHGTGTDLELYKSYCAENDINNVKFTGVYDNKDKELLLRDANVLNNCYGGRDGDELKYAISNRFYDGLLFCIPQIVEPNGYKASVTEENHVGVALEPTIGAANKLYSYIQGLDERYFENCCTKLLDEVIQEDNTYIEKIDKFIKDRTK